MIRNTEDFIDTLKFGAGILIIAAVGLAGLAIIEGFKRRNRYYRPYKPETFDELSGKIKKVLPAGKNEEGAKGTILIMDTDDGELPVHLGPTWYINHQFKRFKPGEEITAGGSRLHFHGRNILVASTLQRGRAKFRLRNKKGHPYWESKITV